MHPKELSLLVIFDAVMTEGSITHAAERLGVTQPAVSNALSRMRNRWNDELLVRDGKQIKPTSFALSFWEQIRAPLRDLDGAVSSDTFDPATSKRTFRICAVSDSIVDHAWCDLRRTIEAEAPGINIYTFPYHLDETESILMTAEVDMIVGVAQPLSNAICTASLYTPRYVCVMRPDHPLARNPLTAEGFAFADHLLVSSMSCEVSDVTDQALKQHGLRRHIAMTVHHFGAVPQIIRNSNLIAVVPSTTVERAIFAGELATSDPPVEIIPTPIVSLWHKRQELDPGLTWLRGHLNRRITDHAEEHRARLERLHNARAER